MEDKGTDLITAFDSLFTTNKIQMLKVLLTRFPTSQQGSFAIYIKFLELQYTLQFLRLRPQPRIPFSKPLSADLFSGDNSDTIELLDELLPFSGPEERTRIENMKNMLQNIAKMKEMFPEGFGSAGENSMDFFSGMAGMPDMSSLFEMFGKEV